MLKESKLLFRMELFYLLEKQALKDFLQLYCTMEIFYFSIYVINVNSYLWYIPNSICPLQNKARQNCKASK